MGVQANRMKIVYVESDEVRDIVVTVGDAIRGQDWARGEYKDDAILQDARSNMYACFLAAKRARLPHTEGTWLDWLDHVTIPDDAPGAGETAEGEADGPSSDA